MLRNREDVRRRGLRRFRRALLPGFCLLLALAPAAGADDGAAIPRDPAGRPLWRRAQFPDRPVRLELQDIAAVRRLLETVPLASFDRSQISPQPGGGVVFAPRVTPAEAAALRRAGYAFTEAPDVEQAGRRAVEEAWARRHGMDGADLLKDAQLDYPTHAQIGAVFAQLELARPDICRRFVWGSSVQGRELWGLVVSAGVDTTAPEPEVRLSSTIHGDEPVGMVLLVTLAQELVNNYGQPGHEDITALVDGREIHILPLHNADGYVNGTRANANFVDLNRNYPEPAGAHPTTQVENVHFMDYAQAHHFVASQNGHGGALVVNYPWDYTYDLTPDDAAVQLLALEYASANLPMSNGPFTDGITNGAEWYVITGSLQDWSYHATGCIDLTVELGSLKWPPASALQSYWDDNRQSLLNLIAAAGWGIGGVVSDGVTGAPLDAQVTVAGNAKPVFTDPAHGDYRKLVPTGAYTLTVTAEGYRDSTIAGVAASWGAATTLDVALTPLATPAPVAAAVRPALAARPNPFNPRTQLTLVNPRDGRVALDVYDLRGRRVRRLLSGHLPAGERTLTWDGRGDDGASVAAGAYLLRLVTPDGDAVRKVHLVK